MDESQKLISLAEDYWESARDNLAKQRYNVAFEAARHAAELAGKAMLLRKIGDFPKRHDIGGDLHRAKLVPVGVDAATLDEFLADYLRGRYEWDEADPKEAQRAVALARKMLDAAKRV
ncbi:MAG: HEPN domain-containing protein [Candidatus Thermoplasmatota archaeon]